MWPKTVPCSPASLSTSIGTWDAETPLAVTVTIVRKEILSIISNITSALSSLNRFGLYKRQPVACPSGMQQSRTLRTWLRTRPPLGSEWTHPPGTAQHANQPRLSLASC